jgi:hypothetical protein
MGEGHARETTTPLQMDCCGERRSTDRKHGRGIRGTGSHPEAVVPQAVKR